MTGKTAAFLMLLGYAALCSGTTYFCSSWVSIFGLMLVVVTGAALIKQSEIK